mmetsp:Transcript_16219/g.29163  ORF Transcript_16219/g.29163 Transcript_16219/m.29163 type:complete len:130 (+) Transcript_16219:17-406(+)
MNGAGGPPQFFHAQSQMEFERRKEREMEKLAQRTSGVSKDLEYLLFDRGSKRKFRPRHVCEFCGKVFQKKGNWRTHMRVHSRDKPFVCEYCGRGFSQKSNMKRHTKLHEPKEGGENEKKDGESEKNKNN